MTTTKDIRIGIIGGSGLGEALGAQEGETREVQTPFGPPSSPITLACRHDVDIAILQRHGPGHMLNPTQVPYRANIYALKSLGVTHIIASGATGSLREHIEPGQVVLVDQVIDKTSRRAGTFYENAAVHVEFAQPFCPVVRQWLRQAADQVEGLTVHDGGCYVVMEGPAFSTVAESHMHRAWGGDLIGMTAMPEAKLAREAEIAYAMIGLPTDYDCWRPHETGKPPQDLLMEIIGNLQRASEASLKLIDAALRDVSLLNTQRCAAHDALKLAIWSDKSKIPKAEINRLAPLWGRYFTD